jgi:alanyl-tRNA synthetase
MGISAGDVVRVAAEVEGGSGGGRPDFAQAGAKIENIEDFTIEPVFYAVWNFLKGKIEGKQ